MREFAFWLRDLRKRSGLTYIQLGTSTHYATSTIQEATAGKRFPTLRVTLAFVTACGGDVSQWRTYWSAIQRFLDSDAPGDRLGSIVPPWAETADAGGPAIAVGAGPAGFPSLHPGQGTSYQDKAGTPAVRADAEAWFVESFSALLRLDTDPIEALEQRVIVATSDGLDELATSVSLPRHPTDTDQAHGLESELLHGGSLELREQPYESYFNNVIVLPHPLKKGERHEYAMRLRIPAGQRMASHYVHVPFNRSDHFELRVRFNPRQLPRTIWVLRGAPTAVIYDRNPTAEILIPDRFGEVHITFHALRLGLGYGVCWQD